MRERYRVFTFIFKQQQRGSVICSTLGQITAFSWAFTPLLPTKAFLVETLQLSVITKGEVAIVNFDFAYSLSCIIIICSSKLTAKVVRKPFLPKTHVCQLARLNIRFLLEHRIPWLQCLLYFVHLFSPVLNFSFRKIGRLERTGRRVGENDISSIYRYH